MKIMPEGHQAPSNNLNCYSPWLTNLIFAMILFLLHTAIFAYSFCAAPLIIVVVGRVAEKLHSRTSLERKVFWKELTFGCQLTPRNKDQCSSCGSASRLWIAGEPFLVMASVNNCFFVSFLSMAFIRQQKKATHPAFALTNEFTFHPRSEHASNEKGLRWHASVSRQYSNHMKWAGVGLQMKLRKCCCRLPLSVYMGIHVFVLAKVVQNIFRCSRVQEGQMCHDRSEQSASN